MCHLCCAAWHMFFIENTKKGNSNVVQNILRHKCSTAKNCANITGRTAELEYLRYFHHPHTICIRLWLLAVGEFFFLNLLCFVWFCFVPFHFNCFFVMGNAVQVGIWIDSKPKQKQKRKNWNIFQTKCHFWNAGEQCC